VGMAGMVEATGMAMVFLDMVTAIAIISSLTTAAGNGAPTARSMSAATIDVRRRKEARPGREARASFFISSTQRGDQSRCKLISLPDRPIGTHEAPMAPQRARASIFSPEVLRPWTRFGNGKRKPGFQRRQAGCVMDRTFVGAQVG
jgi:hypothetical protein